MPARPFRMRRTKGDFCRINFQREQSILNSTHGKDGLTGTHITRYLA